MSCGVIRSSTSISLAFSSICERRGSLSGPPNSVSTATSSSRMMAVMRAGLARMSSRSRIRSTTSRYSLTIFSCSSPVSRCRRICRISPACTSDSWYDPSGCSPALGGMMPAGRSAEASPAARSTISAAIPAAQVRASSRSLATGGVGEVLISSIISSTFTTATARPSRMWPRSRARFSSYTVRRVTTSRRCARNASSTCFRFSSRG